MKANCGLLLCVFLLGLSLATASKAKTVRYELRVSSGIVNLSGKKSVDWALMINGSIPAPTLEFTEGDDAEIEVINDLNDEVSMHWHGLLLPPEMDGVAYVNTPPLLAKQSYTYKFKIRQHGTYWYHSHTNVQEQKGLYGGIIIHPKTPSISYDEDLVVVLSDWSDEDALNILKNLRKDGDYYLYKKNSVRSIFGAIEAKALRELLNNEMDRMGGMDLSDVGYDAFLINGKRNSDFDIPKNSKRIRIRIINAAASTYFQVAMGQSRMRVISSDGIDIEPVLAEEILLGMGETYDLLYDVVNGKSVELKATAQDGTGAASIWIGKGEREIAPQKPAMNLYAPMSHGAGHSGHHMSQSHSHDEGHSQTAQSHEDHDGHNGHDMEDDEDAIPQLTVDHIKSLSKTLLPSDRPRFDLRLVLGGDMERYVWHLNGKAIHEEKAIQIQEGDVVRFTFENETMMHHPMHLHGHFFRVLNDNGDSSPLKHTVDVPPHGTRTIEFYANEPGQWMLHCHNLYHLKTGMARIIEYKKFEPKAEVAAHQKHDPHQHDHLFYSGKVDLFSNYSAFDLKVLRTWDSVELSGELPGYDRLLAFSSDLVYRRWVSNFLNFYGGGRASNEFSGSKVRAVLGVTYTLPFLIESDASVDSAGNASLNLEKRLQWTSKFYSDLGFSLKSGGDFEVEGNLMYCPEWSWAVGVAYRDHQFGGGLKLRF